MNYTDYYGYGDYNDIWNTTNSVLGSTTTSSDPSAAVMGVVGGIIAGFIGLIVIVSLVLTVLQIIGMWKTFVKAGEKGWKVLIPFYNIAMLYKISGMSPYLVFVYIGLIIPIVNIFAGIALAIITLYQKVNLMKGFKASTGLTVVMLMVPFIAYLILGFGKSEYYGFENNNENI